MLRRDIIERKLKELEAERGKLQMQLANAERERTFREYLQRLVKVDMSKKVIPDVDAAFRDQVHRWLRHPEERKVTNTIKGWVLTTLEESPSGLPSDELRELFRGEFGDHRVPSLRQYLSKSFGWVKKVDGRLQLTSKGKSELRNLKQSKK